MLRTLKTTLMSLFVIMMLWNMANAQYFVWCDSNSVTETAIDSIYTTRWEQVSIKFEGCHGWVKWGAPDTSSWAQRKWWYLPEGETLTFGFRTPLKRLAFKSAGANGFFYTAGYKRRAQY